MGLDPKHRTFDQRIVELFTSSAVRADGVEYLHHDDPNSHLYFDGKLLIYGNPHTPDVFGEEHAFIYKPHPSPEAVEVWKSAPPPGTGSAPVEVWLTHGPPKGHLDRLEPKWAHLRGCEEQGKKVNAAKPMICVFGHYHFSYGVEKVTWKEDVAGDGDEIVESTVLTDTTPHKVYDFSGLQKGRETVFINAAWMTDEKRRTEKRNPPIVIDIDISSES
jgi:hypothetical protein